MWMGVPVVTLEGLSHAGRLCASLLHSLGLAQLIAGDEAAFVEIAKGLAEDGAALAALRADLRPRMQKSDLRDGPGLARAIEAAYRDMWRKWCAGEAPSSPRGEEAPTADPEPRADRRAIADALIELPDSEFAHFADSKLYEHYKSALFSGRQDEALNSEEERYCGSLTSAFENGLRDADGMRRHLASLLYRRPFNLPTAFNLELVPHELVEHYVTYMLEAPAIFRNVGDADAYHHYMETWVAYLHSGVVRHPQSPIWKLVAEIFATRANFIPLYFNTAILKNIYQQRAEITEIYLRNNGFDIDVDDWDVDDLPEASQGRKIRVGVAVSTLNSLTDTYTVMPAVQHLDRERFEIILFALKLGTGKSAKLSKNEQYFSSFADETVLLQGGIKNKVKQFRERELDFILIGNNITAVPNELYFLAIHRLARCQIAFNPCCVTTGIKNMDLFVSGTLVEPDLGAQAQYSEKLILFDGPAHVRAQPPFEQKPQAANPENLRPPGQVQFCSGANFFKITPEVRRVWLEILHRTSGSTLTLYPFGPAWENSYASDLFLELLSAEARQLGVSVERIRV